MVIKQKIKKNVIFLVNLPSACESMDARLYECKFLHCIWEIFFLYHTSTGL